jgi:hypothetical protein
LADVKGTDGLNQDTRRAGQHSRRLLVEGMHQFPAYDRRASNAG